MRIVIRFVIRLGMGFLITAMSTVANGQLQLECPLDWNALVDIHGADPDKVIFGVKARDWQKEYLDQMLRKEEECLKLSSDPDSLKEATLADIQKRAYPNAIKAIEERELRRQQIARTQQVADENQHRIDAQQQQQDHKIAAKREPDKTSDAEISQQTLSNRQIAAERQAEDGKSNNLLIFLAVICAAIGGWYWNKFIRLRCKSCNSTEVDKRRIEVIRQWNQTKHRTVQGTRGGHDYRERQSCSVTKFEWRTHMECLHCGAKWEGTEISTENGSWG